MKRCPECRRDYYDDTPLYCLDDGNALLEGPATASSGDEPATAILHSTAAPGEAPTRAQINTTDQTAILHTGAEAAPRESLGGLSERQSVLAPEHASVADTPRTNRGRQIGARPVILTILATPNRQYNRPDAFLFCDAFLF